MPRRRTRTSPLAMLFVALLVLLAALCVLFRPALGGALWRALGPVVAFRNSLSAGQVAQLRAELASTSAALADRDLLAAQNAELRAELGRTDASKQIVAGVLEHPPGTPYDTFVVDAGQAQGVVVGASVSESGMGIGTVDEVYPTTSRVILYSAPGQSYNATLVTQSGAVPVVVEGQGAGSLTARVPAATDVRVGDTVQFPGLNGSLAGTVSAVTGGQTDTFKTLYLHLPFDIFALQYVYIQK